MAYLSKRTKTLRNNSTRYLGGLIPGVNKKIYSGGLIRLVRSLSQALPQKPLQDYGHGTNVFELSTYRLDNRCRHFVGGFTQGNSRVGISEPAHDLSATALHSLIEGSGNLVQP